MPMISRANPRLTRALTLAAWLGAAALAPGCAAFGGGGPSNVAQGKYYSSGNPQYDEFFIALYQLQLKMADSPRVPNAERQSLAEALALSPETPADGVADRLHEEAQKLSRTGIRMRLEQTASEDKPENASATIRASARPKDDASAALFSKLETSATNLRRTASEMKASLTLLAKLEVDAINLDADVPKAFIAARVGKQSEVKKNLADAQKLIVLMKARGDEVRAQCEELLARISKAIDTDDGSLSAPPPEPVSPEPPKAGELKKGAKGHAKPKAASSAPAASPPAAKPKPAAPAKPASDDEAPAKPAAPSKPAPPPKDFEP